MFTRIWTPRRASTRLFSSYFRVLYLQLVSNECGEDSLRERMITSENCLLKRGERKADATWRPRWPVAPAIATTGAEMVEVIFFLILDFYRISKGLSAR